MTCILLLTQARLKKLESELGVIPTLQRKNSELMSEVSSKDLQCKDLQRQLAELQGDCDVFRATLAQKTKAERELNLEIGTLQQEVAQDQRLAARAAAETASLVQQAKIDAKEAATAKRLLEQALDSVQTELRETQRQLSDAKRDAKAANAGKTFLKFPHIVALRFTYHIVDILGH
jgi:chromosome segregation ATPase